MTEAGEIAAALRSQLGIVATELGKLDENVYRVDLDGRPSLVARAFNRPASDVGSDVDVLLNLERAGFPAERVADVGPILDLGRSSVLLTDFVVGQRAPGNGHSFAVLGELLGRLHSRGGASVRAGGAWHLLASSGGPAAELAAATELLDAVDVSAKDNAMLAIVRDELASIDDGADLPEAFVHPDFVPSNAIVRPDEKLVIIDWAGSGRGPRLWSIGWLLWAAGVRSPKLVEPVLSRYLRHVKFTAGELERLEGVLGARAVTIACWELAHGRNSLLETVEHLNFAGRITERTVAQVREIVTRLS
jgi:Ser/Thr protein kinase RdoA (MazF antagonist)